MVYILPSFCISKTSLYCSFHLSNFRALCLTAGAAKDREVIYNLSYPIPNLTYSQCSLFLQTRLWGLNHSSITVPPFTEEVL
jgi:hypothetical protein